MFPEAQYRGRPLHFRHEPTLLDTGGGIKNIADLLGPQAETFLVYNGDILTDLPIGPAIEHHRAAGNEVTLVLRSQDGPKHLAWDAASGRVLDIRNRLGTGLPEAYAFSCVYLVEPAFLDRIPPGQVISVIPIFQEMIRRGEGLGGVLIDGGIWRDLGSRREYLQAHRDLHAMAARPSFPRYGAPDPGWLDWIHPTATIAADARVSGASVVGAGARVGEGVSMEDTILWAGAEIASRAELKGCIVRGSQWQPARLKIRTFDVFPGFSHRPDPDAICVARRRHQHCAHRKRRVGPEFLPGADGGSLAHPGQVQRSAGREPGITCGSRRCWTRWGCGRRRSISTTRRRA